jgi:hypothetical protein
MAIVRPKLDRRIPTDFTHVEKYPGSTLRMLQRTVEHVEKTFTMPARYVSIYDQGNEGACVGFGESILMSILNRRLYDAHWLYLQAQGIDEWPETPPEAGTSLRAGFDILRGIGHRQLWAGNSKPPKIEEGIVDVNRWLTTVDEVRTAISEGRPVVFGLNWYRSFFTPASRKRGRSTEHWIATGAWGRLDGGHCICAIGASDLRQAVKLRNSWGKDYPPVWIAYDKLARLLQEDGEAAIVTDR